MPATSLPRGQVGERPLTQLLSDCGLGAGKQIKDALGRQAVLVNGRAVGLEDNQNTAAVLAPERALYGRYYLIRVGKKKYHLLEVV